jgi:glucokinase
VERTFTIGVDLGGTNLRIASAHSGMLSLEREITVATGLVRGRKVVLEDLCAGIVELIKAGEQNGGRCVGIGIGSPGPLELPSGILRNPPNLKEWDGFNLRAAVEERIGRSVLVESDANVAALGELYAGAGQEFGIDSLCMLTLGTGAGNGLVLKGNIWHGMNGMGGEGGHVIVEPDGAACGCGGRGCLEQYASAPAVVRVAREMGLDVTSAREAALWAMEGQPAAVELFERVGRWIAIALTALINTLNLPLYLIGGGVSLAWDCFAPSMFKHLRQYSYVYRLTEQHPDSPTRVLPASLGPGAGLLGACLAARGVAEGTGREAASTNANE